MPSSERELCKTLDGLCPATTKLYGIQEGSGGYFCLKRGSSTKDRLVANTKKLGTDKKLTAITVKALSCPNGQVIVCLFVLYVCLMLCLFV